jgi:hypothetical protein
MNALARYALNTAKAKTGLSTGVLVGYAAQAVLGLSAFILFFVAIFFVLSDWLALGATKTSIGLFLLFAVLLVGSIIWTNNAKEKTKNAAQRALNRPREPFPFSPPLVGLVLDIGRKVGWRRAVPVVLITVAATGVAAEWTRRHRNNNGLH